jgi:hypothetical protein
MSAREVGGEGKGGADLGKANLERLALHQVHPGPSLPYDK